MKKIAKHLIIDYKKQPAELVCEKCGERKPIILPMEIDDFIKQVAAFNKNHANCNDA